MRGDQVLVLRWPSRNEVRLPKGEVEPGETAEAAALREVMEETGLREQPTVVADLGTQVVEFDYRDRHWVRRERYFLMSCDDIDSVPGDGEPQFEPVWLSFDDALDVLTFEAEREWVGVRDDCSNRVSVVPGTDP